VAIAAVLFVETVLLLACQQRTSPRVLELLKLLGYVLSARRSWRREKKI
jgi:hypothetical protein